MQVEVNLESLQNTLALIDDMNKPRHRRPNGVLDFSVLAKQKLKLKMYKELNHNKPHVHVEYGSDTHKASVAIEDGQLLAGNLDRKYEKAVKEWVISNKEVLTNIWNALRNDESAGTYKHELSGTFTI